jgi:predicted transcriptional regulator
LAQHAAATPDTTRAGTKGDDMENTMDIETHESRSELVELTAGIVSAYVANNTVVTADLAALIGEVHEALSRAANRGRGPALDEPKPAVPVKKSITPDYLICLEDGMKFKSLKRHLRTRYNLSPDDYRDKWELPHDYPMVAPNYADARSELAKKMGLGQRRREK